MRSLPVPDPGEADAASPARFLWWMARGQTSTLFGGMAFGVLWMSAQALMPALIGRAIDHGVARQDLGGLLRTVCLVLVLGIVQAVSGVMRHRFAITNWLIAAYRTVQLTVRHVVHVGGALPRRVAVGEVVTIASSDMSQIGHVMDVIPRFTGSLVAFAVVSVILLTTSTMLGLVVLIGMPLLMVAGAPLLRPLQRRSGRLRRLTADLSTRASDIVAGLRVLRGVGGEPLFSARYHAESQQVRRAGVRVAQVQSVTDALQVLVPGIFVVIVVWVSARQAVSGRLSPGQVVAFYGYASFLTIPLRTVIEFATKLVGAWVSARRICAVLHLEPDAGEPAEPVTALPATLGRADLIDLWSGFRARAGHLTAIVPTDPDAGAHQADRLGLHTPAPDDAVRLGDLPLNRLSRNVLRRHILVSDTAALLFAGDLAQVLDVRGRASENDLREALRVAGALDILDGLPEGLAGRVAERGRTFSGGQRQRLVLARAVLADPPVLVLVEPTSAVDAHTEARIAQRLRQRRQGLTTIVITTSPLLLEVADEVALLDGDRITAVGRHAGLLDTHAGYRAVVTRSVGDPDEGDEAAR